MGERDPRGGAVVSARTVTIYRAGTAWCYATWVDGDYGMALKGEG